MIILAKKILPVTSRPIDDGALVVSKNKITDKGTRKQILKKYPEEKVVDLGDKLLMSGLVNLHAHLELSCLRNKIGEREDFFDWIISLVKEKKKTTKKEMSAATAISLREVIRTGTTCIADVSSTEISVPFLVKSGIRACIFLEALGLDESRADKAFSGLVKRLSSLGNLPDRVQKGISPHASYSVSSKLFNMLSIHSSSNSLPVAIHLSENKDELAYFLGKRSRMDDYMREFGWDSFDRAPGRTPIEAASSFGIKKMIAVHAVHPTAKDFNLLKKSGASTAWCPRSNYFLKNGKAPVEEYVARGINFGLGTDSLASNYSLDMWDEMRFASLVSSLKAFDIIKSATIGGATALGLERITGSIEPGKDADLIAIETEASSLDDPYQALISGTRPEDIVFTMVQGKAIYSKDCHTCYEF